MGDTNDKKVAQNLADLLSDGEFLLDDQKVTLDEIKRWRDTRQNMEKDYTKKTQELAEMRKELQEQMDSITPWLQVQQYFQEHPDKAAELQKLMQEDVTVTTPTGKTEPEIQKLAKEIENLKQQITSTHQEQLFEKQVQEEQKFVQEQLDSLATKYPNMDKELVLAKLMAIPNLDQMTEVEFTNTMDNLAKETHEKRIQYENQVIQDYIKKKKVVTKSEGSGGTLPGFKKEEPKVGDLESGKVRKQATEYLRNLLNP